MEKARFINQHRLLIEATALVKASASDRWWFDGRARKAFELRHFNRGYIDHGDWARTVGVNCQSTLMIERMPFGLNRWLCLTEVRLNAESNARGTCRAIDKGRD